MQPKRRLSSLLSVLVFFVVLAGAWAQHQAILDWWRLRDYQPSARIEQLANLTTMNGYGRKLFYVHHPELNDKSTFRQNCTTHEQALVLGCYITNQRIHIYDVQDVRLTGIHEVTAAHEMLHAAYDRLGSKERQKVDALTQQAYESLTNERIKSVIAQYQAQDTTIVPNELHSIIGTEVRSIPAELEVYYQKYFTDRAQIVNFSEKYEQAFTDREKKIAAYDKQLADLKQQIDSAERELDNLSAALTNERERLDQMLANNQNEAYNAAVPGFNAQIRRYNSLIASSQSIIADYNRIVKERNDIALEEQELVEALDSRNTPQQTQ